MITNPSSDNANKNTLDCSIVWSLAIRKLQVLAGGRFNLSCSTRRHVTKLIGNTTERRAERRRSNLTQVDGNRTPCSLHAELNEECAERKKTETARQDPQRDERACQKDKDDDAIR